MLAAAKVIDPLGIASNLTSAGTVIEPSGLIIPNEPKPCDTSKSGARVTVANRAAGNATGASPANAKAGTAKPSAASAKVIAGGVGEFLI